MQEQPDNDVIEDSSAEGDSDTSSNDTFNIDGEVFTKEQLIEFKKGYMRQSDYTKKTQELAEQRKALSAGVEISNEEGNTDTINTVELTQIQELTAKVKGMELDNEIKLLKEEFSDFDELKALEKANELGINNLRDAYLMTRQILDMEAIRNQLKAELLEEIKKTREVTSDEIITQQKTSKVEEKKSPFSERQKEIASYMGVKLN